MALRRTITAVTAFFVAAATAAAMTACSSGDSTPELTREQAAENAYLFSYPMVAREVTRRISVNVPRPTPIGSAPVNQFGTVAVLPDDTFTTVVRPNVDTLYSSMHFDVSAEPLIIRVPAMGERYHLLPILDAWTNVAHSPGTRTVKDAGKGYEFAITGPNWKGALPDGVLQQAMPTDTGWIIGRFQINGKADLPVVVKELGGLVPMPLSAYGTDYQQPVNNAENPDWPKQGTAVNDYIAGLTPQQYWDLFYATKSHDQTLAADRDTLAQLEKAVGWSPGTKLDLAPMSPADQQLWSSARDRALGVMRAKSDAATVAGWRTDRDAGGDFGSDFRRRGVIAYQAIGYNLLEDSVYANAYDDAQGQPLTSDKNYVLRFTKDQLPPVRAFWSVTIYNGDGFLVKNPIDRFAVRGEQLRANPDGSVDVYVQRTDPGGDKTQNWLPTPESGEFNALARFYWPESPIIDGPWNPIGFAPAP